MERAAQDDAAGGQADLIRAANALAALRCYWGSTHRLATTGGLWWAWPRDGGGTLLAALHPAGLHRQLTRRCGYVPALASMEPGGDEAAAAVWRPGATDAATLRRVVTALRKGMPAVDVLSRHDHLALPAATIERRTYTLLRGTR